MKCAIIGGFLLASAMLAEGPTPISIRVTETAGIRRVRFPATARVHFARGALVTLRNVRLLVAGEETPAQFTAEKSWPNGSVEWLDVDWNASLGPSESATYQLEYGAGITAMEAPRGGLTVAEDDDGIRVGQVRFSKSGNPLVASVKYRHEDIGKGVNGLYVIDGTGTRHEVSEAKAEIVKRGPLLVVIRYAGKITVANDYSVSFTMTIEMPSSKTLVKVAISLDDPSHRLREVGLGTPLGFSGPMPWLWDFGTFRWTYGSLRSDSDSVTMTQTPAGDWTLQTGTQVYEKSPAGHTEPVRWGHFQDGREVVAFAVERGRQETGAWRVTFNGGGQAMYSFVTEPSVSHYDFAVSQHFVMSPVQLGAVTSPPSILSPLEVVVLPQ
jgi:hypothetical protein